MGARRGNMLPQRDSFLKREPGQNRSGKTLNGKNKGKPGTENDRSDPKRANIRRKG